MLYVILKNISSVVVGGYLTPNEAQSTQTLVAEPLTRGHLRELDLALTATA